MYPYMARNRDFKLVKKVLLVALPPITLFCAACFIWAEPLCRFFLGPEFGPAGTVLRAMLPVGVVTLPNYILGFPTLGAMGLSKYANYSVVFGSVLHVCNLLILFLTGNVNMVTLAILVSVAESAILIFRIVVIVRNRHLMRPVEESDHG
jgi:PST family polysaccharide transporter